MILRARLCALFAGVLGLCATAHAQTTVNVAYSPSVDYVSVFIAKENGYFKRRGLDVNMTPMLSSLVPTALASGSAQIGMPSAPVALSAIDAGLDQPLFMGAAVADPSITDVGILVRPAAGIGSAKDLEGRKVGVPGIGAVLHVLVKQWLAQKGADPSKVNFVEVALPTMPDVLKGGSVDAVLAVDPITTRIVSGGAGTMLAPIFKDLPAGTLAVVFTVRRDWAQANPKALADFRAALAEAAEFAARDKGATRQMVGRFLRLSPEVLAATRDPFIRLGLTDAQIADWIAIMQRQSLLRAKTAVTDFVLR